MHELGVLVALCFSMLLGSYFSGTIPLTFQFSQTKSLLTPLAGGIMIGTGMAVIIPEGINSMLSKSPHYQHLYHQASRKPSPSQNSAENSPYVIESNAENTSDQNTQENSEKINAAAIGFSLISGFVLMLLIDQLSVPSGAQHSNETSGRYMTSNQYDNQKSAHELQDVTANSDHSLLINLNDVSPDENHRSETKVKYQRATPTIGLVIHASADGIALGAAATMNHRDVEMIIFLAIMLHKAPAAFSLVVFLMHRGLKHSVVRTHLMAFSLSAPLAALLTYFGLSQAGKEALQRNNATGIAMLFSAGTFLYVATVHVLPDLIHERRLTRAEIVSFVVGSFLPSILTKVI